MDRASLKASARAQLGNSIFSNNWLMAVVLVLITGVISSVTGPVSILLVGIVQIATMAFFKEIVRQNKADLMTAVNGVTKDVGGTLVLGLLYTIFISLWSLLFVIPGIVKSYAYSMAFYLKDEHPEWGWKECLDESQRLTKGHKMELFVLDLSFIGWYIVGAIALGIGALWVAPYHIATRINYFEQLTSVN